MEELLQTARMAQLTTPNYYGN